MEKRQLSFKKKDLNRLNSNKLNMKRGARSELKGEELIKSIKEAQKDPEFIREINKFIKVTTS
ncbi:hypothetical protein HZB88_01490 [archaeon]|nr:hypothetical protein [archaeon]